MGGHVIRVAPCFINTDHLEPCVEWNDRSDRSTVIQRKSTPQPTSHPPSSSLTHPTPLSPYCSFLKRFGAVTPEGVRYIPAQWQSALSNGSSAGGIIGLMINGWAAERFGPKQVYMGECCYTGKIDKRS